ncbi:MAG TPA: HDOD domain-containing protein, partial [Phycisphaerae bacterium]|nr:HDOD domain-containing protein [Phycisphaerae bacterium]
MRTQTCPKLPTLDLQSLVASADLPTMPAATVRLLRLGGNRDATVDQIAEIVATDPKLAARVLSMANSAENYRGNAITTIPRACAHIGMRQIRSLALTLHLFSFEQPAGGMDFDYARFWRYSLTSATAAKLLAGQLRTADPEEAYVVGLLQDLGVLVLHRSDAKGYAEVRRAKALSNIRLYQQETELLGYNHADVGAAFAAQWSLPVTIGRAIRNSHTPGSDPLSTLAFLADQVHTAIFDHNAMAETDAINTLHRALNG